MGDPQNGWFIIVENITYINRKSAVKFLFGHCFPRAVEVSAASSPHARSANEETGAQGYLSHRNQLGLMVMNVDVKHQNSKHIGIFAIK